MSTAFGINANKDATAARQGVPEAGSANNGLSVDETPKQASVTDTGTEEIINEKPSSSPAETLGKDDNGHSEMERRTSIIQALARSYSHASAAHPHAQNPFQAGEDSPLNPNSPNFSGHKWAKAIVELVQQDGHAFRATGVYFQNLNVYGFGEASNYQSDIANVWLSAGSVFSRLTSSSHKRIDILRGFDSIVHKGEMLVLLGPPGASYSTTLKTIASELNGIYVDDSSYFNYQGMTAKEIHSHHRGKAIYTAEVDIYFP
ncbi:Multidrug resistance protein [Fusarium solani]|nr:Multidrug resistance protein [Fusarium solani]